MTDLFPGLRDNKPKKKPTKPKPPKPEDLFAAECRTRRQAMDMFRPFNSAPYLREGTHPNLFSDEDYTKCMDDLTVSAAVDIFGALVVAIERKT